MAAWTCPRCGAPFANRNASHSCVRVALAERFEGTSPAVRAAFDRLDQLVSVDGAIPAIAQKTRIVFAAPMRFLAVSVWHDRLVGHVLNDRPVEHPLVTAIVANAYGSGLFLHRFEVASPDDFDPAFAALVREAANRVGRRKRLAVPSRGAARERH